MSDFFYECLINKHLGPLTFYLLDSFTRNVSSTSKLLNYFIDQKINDHPNDDIICLFSNPITSNRFESCGRVSPDIIDHCPILESNLYQSSSDDHTINNMLKSDDPFSEIRYDGNKIRLCLSNYPTINKILELNNDKRYVFIFVSCRSDNSDEGHRIILIFDQMKNLTYLIDPNGSYNFYTINIEPRQQIDYISTINNLFQGFICQFNKITGKNYTFYGQINCIFLNHLNKCRSDDLGKCVFICIFISELMKQFQYQEIDELLDNIKKIECLQNDSQIWYNYLVFIVERLIQDPTFLKSYFPEMSTYDFQHFIELLQDEIYNHRDTERDYVIKYLKNWGYHDNEIDRISKFI